MASASKRRNQPAAIETSDTIAQQVASFVKDGGKIEEVPRGVSGQVNTSARKHITISNKS